MASPAGGGPAAHATSGSDERTEVLVERPGAVARAAAAGGGGGERLRSGGAQLRRRLLRDPPAAAGQGGRPGHPGGPGGAGGAPARARPGHRGGLGPGQRLRRRRWEWDRSSTSPPSCWPTRRWGASGCTTWWPAWWTRASRSRASRTACSWRATPPSPRPATSCWASPPSSSGRSRELAALTGMLTACLDEGAAQAALVVGPRRHRQVAPAAGVPGRGPAAGAQAEGAVRGRRLAGGGLALRAAGQGLCAGTPGSATASRSRRAGASWGSVSRPTGRQAAGAGVPGRALPGPFPRFAERGAAGGAGQPAADGRPHAPGLRGLAQGRVRPAAGAAGARGSALGRRRHGGLPRRGAAQPARLALAGAGAGPARGARDLPRPVGGQPAAADRSGPAVEEGGREAGARGAGRRAAPAATVAAIVARADGNPFYLEELVRAARDGRTDGLPDSILGMVQARLDAEGDAAKRVLRAASIFGERFSRDGLAALLGGEAELPQLNEWVERLAERELIAHQRRRERLRGRAVVLPRPHPRRGLRDVDRGGPRAGPPAGRRLPRAGRLSRRHGAGRALPPRRSAGAGGALVPGGAPSRRCGPATWPGPSRRARGGAAGDRARWIPRRRTEVELDTEGALRLTQTEAHLWRAEFELAVARGNDAIAGAAIRVRRSGSGPWGRPWSATASRPRWGRSATWWGAPSASECDPQAVDAQVVCLAWAVSFLFMAGRLAEGDRLFERAGRDRRRAARPGPADGGAGGAGPGGASLRRAATSPPACRRWSRRPRPSRWPATCAT